MNGKYCLSWGEDFKVAVRNDDSTTAQKFKHQESGEPKGDFLVSLQELCAYEALKGQKSHWFRFMDTLINGCVVNKNSTQEGNVKLVTDACFHKALKFSRVYANYDENAYTSCLN